MMRKLPVFALVFALMATAGAQVAPNPRAKAGLVLLQNPPPPELIEMCRASQKNPLALTVYLDDESCRARLTGKAHTLRLRGGGQVSEERYLHERIISGARALGVIGAKEAVPLLVDRYQRSIGGYFPEDFFLVRPLARLGDSRALPVLSWAIRNFVGYTQAQMLPLEPDEPDVVWTYWQVRTRGMSAREAAREVLKAAEGGNLRGGDLPAVCGQGSGA